MKTKILSTIIMLCLAQASMATNTSNSLKASATLAASCQLSVESIALGLYNPTSGDSLGSSNITLTCTRATSATIGITYTGTVATVTNKYARADAGTATYARQMKNGTATLYYNLFQDSQYTTIFGGSNYFVNNTSARPTVVGTGDTQTVPIYAALASGQYVKPGSYSDTMTVVLTY